MIICTMKYVYSAVKCLLLMIWTQYVWMCASILIVVGFLEYLICVFALVILKDTGVLWHELVLGIV